MSSTNRILAILKKADVPPRKMSARHPLAVAQDDLLGMSLPELPDAPDWDEILKNCLKPQKPNQPENK